MALHQPSLFPEPAVASDKPPVVVHIDFETYSLAKLEDCGAWAYSLDLSTDVWCMAYHQDSLLDATQVWQPGDPVPATFVDQPIIVAAHNYAFEEAIWVNIMMARYGFPEPVGWECTMALAARYNLPQGLDELSRRLGVVEEKDAEGKRLMVVMANRRTYDPTVAGSTAAKDHPQNFARLLTYCCQDVRTEMAVYRRLVDKQNLMESSFWKEFRLDRAINNRGVCLDEQTSVAVSKAIKARRTERNKQVPYLTENQVEKVTQVVKLKDWLKTQGYQYDSVTVYDVEDTLLNPPAGLTPDAVEVLKIRQQAALGSLAKFAVVPKMVDNNGRAHGLFQLYGASQTGRWAGRMLQIQNLPRMDLSDPEIAMLVNLFRAGDIEVIDFFYDDLFDIAKSMIRPMVIAPEGSQLIVSDLAQIECRVLAWLSGCSLLSEQFASKDRDPYSEMAAAIYNKPADQCGKGTSERQIGKSAVLGCGYQMGAKRFRDTVKKYNHIDMGEGGSKSAVFAFRETYPEIPKFWYALDNAAEKIARRRNQSPHQVGKVSMFLDGAEMVIRLPSGRTLHYPDIDIETDAEKEDHVSYRSSTNKRVSAYGGSLAENITQAVARDVLTEAMLRMDASPIAARIVAHVHDEVILEGPAASTKSDLEKVNQIMSTSPEWAKDLVLDVESASCTRYTK